MLLGSILIIGIAMGGIAQLWSTQVKREKEADLLFRLGAIRTGLLLYRANHNRFPNELKDLLLDTSQIQTRRYLRQIYTDPMTGKADWQLKIQIDPTGATSGIQDVHSKSEKKPLKTFTGVNAASYKDW
jgi:type II secretory pathway pseudopilin PulG